MVKVFILISPFAILSLSLPSSSSFFKSWIQCFLSLLFIQILVSIILLIIFSFNFDTNNIFTKFLMCGAIFTLIRANSYIKEFMGGVSIDFSSNITSIRNFFK